MRNGRPPTPARARFSRRDRVGRVHRRRCGSGPDHRGHSNATRGSRPGEASDVPGGTKSRSVGRGTCSTERAVVLRARRPGRSGAGSRPGTRRRDDGRLQHPPRRPRTTRSRRGVKVPAISATIGWGCRLRRGVRSRVEAGSGPRHVRVPSAGSRGRHRDGDDVDRRRDGREAGLGLQTMGTSVVVVRRPGIPPASQTLSREVALRAHDRLLRLLAGRVGRGRPGSSPSWAWSGPKVPLRTSRFAGPAGSRISCRRRHGVRSARPPMRFTGRPT